MILISVITFLVFITHLRPSCLYFMDVFFKLYSLRISPVLPSPRYSHLRFVRTAEVLCGRLPLLPAEFEDIVRRHCLEARDVLQHKSVPALAAVDKWNISGSDLDQGPFLKQILDTDDSSPTRLPKQRGEYPQRNKHWDAVRAFGTAKVLVQE